MLQGQRRLFALLFEHVAVHVQGEAGAAVAQAVSQRLRVKALVDGEAGVGVPNVVDADAADLRLVEQGVPVSQQVPEW